MAAASSVVELCTLADRPLDAATSAKFFHDDDGAGGAISSSSWPEAEKTKSKLISESALRVLCGKYSVPDGYTPTTIDLVGGWVACRPPPEGSNTICVYADALEAGMRIPLHKFYVAVLGHYGLAPSQLTPDAWRYMAAFVLLSKDAGVEPSLPAFRSFFSICTDGGDSVGWHHFKSRPGSCLFSDKMPRSPEWKHKFFFIRSPSTRPWPCAVKWGKPSRAAVRMPVVTTDTDMVMRKLLDRAGSLGGVDVVQFLSRRSLPVAPPPVSLTLTPQHKPKLVKVGSAGAAAEPPRKPKSISDTHTPGLGLVNCIAEASEFFAGASEFLGEASELAKKTMTELDATKGEVAQLKEALSVANANHKASTAHAEEVKAEVAKLRKERAAEVAKLKKEHAAVTERLNKENAAAVSELTERINKEHAAGVSELTERLNKKHAAAVSKLTERLNKEHAAAVSELTKRLNKEHAAAVARLNEDHATSIDRLKEEHAVAVTLLKEKHAAEVGQLDTEHHKAAKSGAEHHRAARAAEVAKLQDKHAADVARLKEEHAVAVTRLKEKHAAKVGQLADEHRKAAERGTEHHKAEVAKLEDEHAATVARLKEDHATIVNHLKEEHVADVTRVEDAADKELQDTKKDIMLRLFLTLDVSLLERLKLKGDPSSAGAGTPKAEDRS